MIKIKKAFTLIELLVVISIITIISSSGVFYFLDFVKQQEISQKLNIIEDNLQLLDKQVKNYDIFDYELQLSTSNTGNLLYKIYLNNFDTKNQSLTVTDINTGSGYISSIGSGTGEIKIYKNNKLFLLNNIVKNSNYLFNFKETYSYKITGTYSGEILNSIELRYFSEENIYPENNNLLELVDINTKEDKTGTGYNNLIVTNIGGKKVLGNNENEIYLHFENNGKESFIKIKK